MSLCISKRKQQDHSLLPKRKRNLLKELLQTVEPSVLAGAKNHLMSTNANQMLDTDFYHNMNHFGLTIGWIIRCRRCILDRSDGTNHDHLRTTWGSITHMAGYGLIWFINRHEGNASCSQNNGINRLRIAAGSRGYS